MSDKFQPYLDSVTKSGERTRNVWYLLVLVVIAAFFGEWNTREENISTRRFVEMMNALVCVSDKNHAITIGSPSCEDAARYGQIRHHFTQDFERAPSAVQDATKQILQKRVEDLMRRELEAHVVTIPILGVTIDGNDLWILSTLVMLFLLRVLLACLEREKDNMSRAARQAADDANQRELIVMSQLFASRLNHYHPLAILLFSPLLLNLYGLYTDYWTWETGKLLRGLTLNGLTLILQILLTLVLGWLCLRCFQAARGIEELISKLEKPVPAGT